MTRHGPDRVVVVIPAHDEEQLVADAVRAVQEASAHVPEVETSVVVVANGCTDRTASVAAAAGAVVIEAPTAVVGAARAAGMAWAFEQSRGSLDRLWLATTDADSQVGPRWLAAQLDAARGGAEMYLGTVTLDDVDRTTFSSWTAGYESSVVSPACHGHVHGASMGMAAPVYVSVGGFGRLAVGEDADLVSRAIARGVRIAWDDTCPVLTSGRLVARAPAGVSRDLALSLDVCDEAV